MSSSAPPPPTVVATPADLDAMLRVLTASDHVAVDTESNSLHAYRERVCLIQFSVPGTDFVVDPVALKDLTALAPLFANPGQQKILHAAENDLAVLARDYGFTFANIFDTMAAARSLGWAQVGLAAILEAQFGVKLNKAYQRADWGRRPLLPAMLDYARFDTHYLAALRDRQSEALVSTGHWPEVFEEFERLARVRVVPDAPSPDPMAFWRVKGAYDLGPQQAAILQVVYQYREAQAERQDVPPFKVMGEPTLLELARHAPRSTEGLHTITGMTPPQIGRHGRHLLHAIEQGLQAPGLRPPRNEREPDEVRDRYDLLHTWRKNRAKVRGVESDVILPRTVLRELSRNPPRSHEDLTQVVDFGPRRREMYGGEILALLTGAGAATESA
jgi:ribonuclease D